MTEDVAGKRRTFKVLHAAGCFLLPNPFDAGSAVRLARLGFKALASTSAGLAWSLGRDDYGVTLEEVLAHLRQLSAATSLPMNADFEQGFADAPEAVAENVLRAAETGIAGLSIEDNQGGALYGEKEAAARLRAVRQAIDRHAPGLLLVGRYEGVLLGDLDIGRVIRRLCAYAEAGADCLYAPGLEHLPDIEAVVRALAPKPLNVLLMNSSMRLAELEAVGVRRVSTGGKLARAAWQGFDAAAGHLARNGCLP